MMSPTPSTQDLFDAIARHLLMQNGRASAHGGQACFYRAPGGRKCAVGCLISDEHYSGELEGKAFRGPEVQAAVERSICRKLSRSEKTLLARLQGVHDYSSVFSWRESLLGIAKAHSLSAAVLEEFP